MVPKDYRHGVVGLVATLALILACGGPVATTRP